ncbi:PF01934 family protein [Leptospira wolbachii serovar Codice str. CDC]|uniref:PF01934 family protein n=2 Tax=Leptospira TaxID=171 RepID=R8ZZI3_9LEPT|nr:PF01934 family protein [Leptospira wolbachii serovar Codice str. CDC]
MILDIERIIERHESLDKALDDFEGNHALLMCLQQIGEALGKLKNESWKIELESKEASLMRNYIVHDYLGIKLEIIKKTITINIPVIKEKILNLIHNK